jgi:lipopolysaccharide biosynthesis regulator YciM
VGLEGASGHPVLAHLLAAAARSALGASDVEEAEVLAERAVAVRAESPDAQLALGEVRLKQGRALQAAALLRKAVELEPELAPRAVRMLNASMGEAVEVQRFLERQISRSPQPAPFELALALHHRSCGAFDRAIALLRRLVDRHPRFWDARRELGTLLLEHDRSEEMRADYEEILGTLGQQPAAFRCGACRQNLPDHTFRCPACEGWDTIYREIDPRSLAA